MTGAANIKYINQSAGFVPIVVTTGTTIERPIRRPAMKLPVCGKVSRECFTMRSGSDDDDGWRRGSRCVGALTVK